MSPSSQSSPTPVRVTYEGQTRSFTQPFRIGRVEDCDFCIKNDYVSRAHVEVVWDAGSWWVRDLNSSNGLWVNGQRIPSAPIQPTLTARLGVQGPELSFAVDPPPAPAPPANLSHTMVARAVDHYFTEKSDQPAGHHTMMVRAAFQQVHKKQKRQYAWIIGALAVVLLAAGGYTFYLHQQVSKQKAMAEGIFYAMKSLDLDIANVERIVEDSQSQQGKTAIHDYRKRRQDMEKNYDQFLSSLRTYNTKLSEPDRLILRMARVFGECEIDMPPEFVSEVHNYIQKWQSSKRYVNAVHLAQEKGYTPVIAKEFLTEDLPPQFFYLAMQESDFDQYISGPMTYKGIAKGMWQFIPETAVKYGLHVGPLADLPRPDPADDRHHWDRATIAAAKYIKYIYSTDAQASGLLVIASYNWGEDKVVKLIDTLPPNPKERNFWQLLAKYHDKIPQQTYDYVYYIFSAAVIGENPRLFGFDFDNPLAQVKAQ